MRKIRNSLKKLSQEEFNVVTLSPAIGKRLADATGVLDDCFYENKIVGMLQDVGVNCVLNLADTAEYSLKQEAEEFLKYLEKGERKPFLTGFCPTVRAIVKQSECKNMFYMSDIVSPAVIQDQLVREKFREKGKLWHLIVVPCNNKCEEVNSAICDKKASKVILVNEFLEVLYKNNCNVDDYPQKEFYYIGSKAMFRPEYGAAQKILSLAGYEINWVGDSESLRYHLRSGFISVRGKKMKIAVAKGRAAIETLMKKINLGERYIFVEMLACSNGCCGND